MQHIETAKVHKIIDFLDGRGKYFFWRVSLLRETAHINCHAGGREARRGGGCFGENRGRREGVRRAI